MKTIKINIEMTLNKLNISYFKIITEHSFEYYYSYCGGCKNNGYNGAGHKCICV